MSDQRKLLDLGAFKSKGLPSSEEVRDAIGIVDSLDPHEVIRIASQGGLCHIVQDSSIAHAEELLVAEAMMKSPARFFASPIEMILGAQPPEGPRMGIHVNSFASEKKTRAIVELGGFLAGLPKSRTIAETALLIADELVTNACKNAWSGGARVFDGEPSRDGEVDFWAESDGSRLVLACRDSFGELDVARLVERIYTCYDLGVANSIRQGTGGAGIGSWMIFDSCISYYAGVDPGRHSVIAVALALGKSRKDLPDLAKNIHLIISDSKVKKEVA